MFRILFALALIVGAVAAPQPAFLPVAPVARIRRGWRRLGFYMGAAILGAAEQTIARRPVAISAGMGRTWCFAEPTVRIGSHIVSVNLAVQASQVHKVSGPAVMLCMVPEGDDYEILFNEAPPGSAGASFAGFGIDVQDAPYNGPAMIVFTCPTTAGNVNILADVTIDDGETESYVGHSKGLVVPIE